MSTIKTFEDVCKHLGKPINPTKFLTLKKLLNKVGFTFIIDYPAYIKIEMIAEALNNGTKLSWRTPDQKYYPWFYLDNFRFDCSLYCLSGSDVSARMCFKTEELSNYAAQTFLKEYEEWIMG